MKEIEKWATNTQIIFIGGMTRTGTTLLYNTLRNHSLIQIPCADNLSPETFLFINLNQKIPISFNPMLYSYLGGHAGVMHWINIISPELHNAGFSIITIDTKKNPVVAILSPLKNKNELNETLKKKLAWSFFYTAQQLCANKIIIEKTPSHISSIEMIFNFFPKSKFIYCHRDPVNIVASIRKRLKKEIELGRPAESLRWLSQDIMTYINQYNHSLEQYVSSKQKYADRIQIIEYEKLTRFPRDILGLVSEFLDIQFEEAMVTGERKAHAAWESTSSKKIEQNKYDISEYLSNDEIAIIEKNTKKIAF